MPALAPGAARWSGLPARHDTDEPIAAVGSGQQRESARQIHGQWCVWAFGIEDKFSMNRTTDMPIWQRPATPEAIEARLGDSLPGAFGIRILEVGRDFLRAEMPVDRRHVQPYGILHGGASVVLAETLGSIATTLTLPEGQYAVGLEVNANHVSAVPEGEIVTALCRPLHLGRRTQVWQTEIHRPNGKLACVSRLTTAVLDRKAG